MRSRPVDETKEWLARLETGEVGAVGQMVELLYGELRGVARARRRGEWRHGHTLSTTALVHEAYLKLQRHERIGLSDRTAFLAAAAVTMRRILVDHARQRRRLKRGGGAAVVPLEGLEIPLTESELDEILALDQALERLAPVDPRAVEVVQLRFFAGLTLDEAAEHLGTSKRTVQRKWLVARAWLRKELAADVLDDLVPGVLAEDDDT